MNTKKVKTVFPSVELIYNKDVIRENDPFLQKPKIINKKFEEDKKAKPVQNIKSEKKDIIDSLNSLETTDTSAKEEVFKKIHQLFQSKDKSRFDFSERKTDDRVEIPDFINNLIIKKVSRHKLTKNINHIDDLLYGDKTLVAEYTNNNQWAQFIFENRAFNDEWEFIQDFDYINTLILNKRK